MTDTPRTDKLKIAYCDMPYMDEAKALTTLCHELERENARLTTSLSRNNAIMGRMAGENAKLREALKWAEPYVPKRTDCESRRMIESFLPNVQAQR